MDAFLQNTSGLILGASSGFGEATARALAAAGMDIFGVHLDRAAGQQRVDTLQVDLKEAGSSGRFFNVNAADPEKRAVVIEGIAESLGQQPKPLRLLLHSLAFGALRPLISEDHSGSVTESQVAMTQNVMASSLLFWTQDLLAAGLIGEGTRIIAMTSSGARRVLPHYGAVSAAKAALEAYVRQLAFEGGSMGLRVNAIEAGVTDTPALRKIPGDAEIKTETLRKNPFNRLTVPSDVATVVRSLCGEAGDWINGTVMRVDGGEGIVELDWREEN